MASNTRPRLAQSILAPMVGVLLLAAALRLYRIDFRALWFDEGVSLTFAHLPLGRLMFYTRLWEEVNPPLYRLALGLWTYVVGTTAFTARWFSGWLGVIAVALTYRVARRLELPHRAALTSAALLALAPMQVYYSQEAKGYPFIQVFVLLMVWLWLLLLDPSCPRRWLLPAIGVTSALALGSHSTLWLMLAAVALWTLLWARNRLLEWLLIAGVAGAGWLVWAMPVAQGVMRGAANAADNAGLTPLDPFAYLGTTFSEFAAGPVGPDWLRWVLTGCVLLLAAWGFLRVPARQTFLLSTRSLLTSWLLVPVLLGLGVQVAVPFFFPRFFLYVTPALWLLVALGLEALPRRWMLPLGAGVLVVLMAFLLTVNYMRPSEPATDYRPLAADLTRHLQPGDALVYSYSWQPGFLDAYLPDDRRPTYYLSFFPPETIGRDLGDILSRHGRVWLVTYQLGAEDPIHDAGQWLLAHAATPGSEWYGDAQLSLFLGPDALADPGAPTNTVSFDGGRITLTYPQVTARATPGDPVGLSLTWQPNEPIPERYVVFVHLLGDESSVPLAQQDIQSVNNLRPTYTWIPGEQIRDDHALWLPIDLPPGQTLHLVVGLYDGDTLQRVPVDGGGDNVPIGQVVVDPQTSEW